MDKASRLAQTTLPHPEITYSKTESDIHVFLGQQPDQQSGILLSVWVAADVCVPEAPLLT